MGKKRFRKKLKEIKKQIFAILMGIIGGVALVSYIETYPNSKISKFVMRILK